MPSTTSYSFGDIVLVAFPFTNQVGSKKRPAVVVSSADYNRRRRDVILIAITSQRRHRPGFAEVIIRDWQAAGLLKPSLLKPVVFTAEKRIVIKRLGRLKEDDQQAARTIVQTIIG